MTMIEGITHSAERPETPAPTIAIRIITEALLALATALTINA